MISSAEKIEINATPKQKLEDGIENYSKNVEIMVNK